jgi:hypothetical protein
VALRTGCEADRPFIESTWRRNYERVGRWTSCPGGVQEYIATQAQVITTCLATSEVLVACPAERPEQILGWCCFRRPATVHYVFVKPYYRESGLALRMLTEALGELPQEPLPSGQPVRKVYSTHVTRRGGAETEGAAELLYAAGRRGYFIEYNPALIFGGGTRR